MMDESDAVALQVSQQCERWEEELGAEVTHGASVRVYLPLDHAHCVPLVAQDGLGKVELGNLFVGETGRLLGSIPLEAARTRWAARAKSLSMPQSAAEELSWDDLVSDGGTRSWATFGNEAFAILKAFRAGDDAESLVHGLLQDPTFGELASALIAALREKDQKRLFALLLKILPAAVAENLDVACLLVRVHAALGMWQEATSLFSEWLETALRREDVDALMRLRDHGRRQAGPSASLAELNAQLAQLESALPRFQASLLDDVVGRIESIPPFVHAPRSQIEAAIQAHPPRLYHDNQVLLRKGDDDNDLLIVIAGRARTFLDDPTAGATPVQIHLAGDVVGERRILNQRLRRNAWICASDGAVVWKLPRSFIEPWLELPAFRHSLERIARERALNAFLARSADFVRPLTYFERRHLITLLSEPIRLDAGASLVDYRRPADGLYFVCRGALVERQYPQAGALDRYYHAGALWGALESGGQANLVRTVRATEDSTVIRIPFSASSLIKGT